MPNDEQSKEALIRLDLGRPQEVLIGVDKNEDADGVTITTTIASGPIYIAFTLPANGAAAVGDALLALSREKPEKKLIIIPHGAIPGVTR